MGRHIGLQFRVASEQEAEILTKDGESRGRVSPYPFQDMEVSMAIVADGDKKYQIRCALQGLKRRKGYVFKTKTLSDGSLLVKRVQ